MPGTPPTRRLPARSISRTTPFIRGSDGYASSWMCIRAPVAAHHAWITKEKNHEETLVVVHGSVCCAALSGNLSAASRRCYRYAGLCCRHCRAVRDRRGNRAHNDRLDEHLAERDLSRGSAWREWA